MKKTISISFTNYSESIISIARRSKNLFKLFVVISQIIYAVYLGILKTLKSRVLFYKEENFSQIRKRVYRNEFFGIEEGFLPDYKNNIQESFKLSFPSPLAGEEIFVKSVTKEGIKNFILYRAFLKRCVELFYNDDFCYNKKDLLSVKIFSVNDLIQDDKIANISQPYTLFLSLNSNDIYVKKITGDKKFLQYILDILKDELPFYKLEGISIT